MKNDDPAAAARPARRGWLIGVLTVLLLAGAGAAMTKVPDVGAVWARLTGKPEVKPVVPLEFVPTEVTRPVYAPMPILIEFSGPLVAPRTAVVRAKAPGTLLSAAGRRRQPRQGRAGARRRSTWPTCRAASPSARRCVESAQADAGRGRAPHATNGGLAEPELHLADRAADLAGRGSTRRARS